MSKKSVVSLKQKLKPTVKTSLLQPYFPTWSQLPQEKSTAILEFLVKLLEAHPELKRSKSAGKKKSSVTGIDSSTIRSSIVVGLQEVTKALERDRALFFLVCSSCQPKILNHHLLVLSGIRGVPTASIPDLSLHISPLLGIKSAIAIAVLKDSQLLDVTEAAAKIIPHLRVTPLQWTHNRSLTHSSKNSYVGTKICVNSGGIKKRL